MTTNTQNVQFENKNSLRKYPVAEAATCLDDTGKTLPCNLIVDLSVVSFVSLVNPYISSLYIGPAIVSITLSDDRGAFAVATGSRDDFDDEVQMDSLRDGVHSSIRISVGGTQNSSYRFSSKDQSGIHEYCIVDFPRTGVQKIVDDVSGAELIGDIGIEFEFDAGVNVSQVKTDTGYAVLIEPTKSLSSVLSDGCVPTDLNRSCVVPVVQTINGVSPDRFGNIAIILE